MLPHRGKLNRAGERGVGRHREVHEHGVEDVAVVTRLGMDGT